MSWLCLCLTDMFALKIVGPGDLSQEAVMSPREGVIIQKSHFWFNFEFLSYEYLYSAMAREEKKKS